MSEHADQVEGWRYSPDGQTWMLRPVTVVAARAHEAMEWAGRNGVQRTQVRVLVAGRHAGDYLCGISGDLHVVVCLSGWAPTFSASQRGQTLALLELAEERGAVVIRTQVDSTRATDLVSE